MTSTVRLTEGDTISTAELRELLKHRGVEFHRYLSLRRGTADVELRQPDGQSLTVTVTDRA